MIFQFEMRSDDEADMLRAFIGYLLLASGKTSGALQSTCQPAKANHLDFVCGDIPSPFQPCHADFNLINGKATTATTLWLLGEDHSDRDLTNECLEALTENAGEHIVYVEGTESGKEVRCKDKSVNERKGRKCIGWDNMLKKADIEKLPSAGQAVYPRIIQNIKKALENKPDKKFDEILIQKRKEYRQIEENDKTLCEGELRNIRANIRVWNFLLDLRNNGYSYKKIFENNMDEKLYEISDSEMEKYKKLQEERNKKMTDTLSNSPDNLFRVVIVGKQHVDSNFHPKLPGSADSVHEALQAGKDKNNYAVLSMKKF